MFDQPSTASSALELPDDMLATMLARARGVGALTPERMPNHWMALATDFEQHLDEVARAYLDPTASVWRDCAESAPVDLAIVHQFWPAAVLADLCVPGLSGDLRSVPGIINPKLALAIQSGFGSELSADLIYDSTTDQAGCFVTRGCRGGVMSNLLFYFCFSARYWVLPVFHTHPGNDSELGPYMPSAADYWVMHTLRDQLGGAFGERVYFADGSYTQYGLIASGAYYFRRQGETAYLFPWPDMLI